MFGTRSRRTLGFLSALAMLGAVQLVAAPAAHADDDNDPYCYTNTSTKKPLYRGPSASRIYDWINPSIQVSARFSPGVDIPVGLLGGRYVPQGLASWSNWNGRGEDLLLISAYHDGNGNKDPDGSSAVFGVVANGSRAGTGLGRMLIANGHVGGVAVYGGWLYVGSESTIRGYRLSTLRNALAGANPKKQEPAAYNRPSSFRVSYLGTGDGHLWAGTFSENSPTHLNGYVQTSRSAGTLAFRSGTQVYAPKKTQGVAVTAGHVIFSTSYGRNDRGNIWIFRRGQQNATDRNSYCFRAPSMNQGVTVLNGRLHLGFESGAYTYNHGWDDPDNPITRLHSARLSLVTSLFSEGPED